MIVASAYTPTDSGWGVEFLVAVVVLAIALWAVVAVVRLVASTLHRHRRSDLTPLRPLPLRRRS